MNKDTVLQNEPISLDTCVLQGLKATSVVTSGYFFGDGVFNESLATCGYGILTAAPWIALDYFANKNIPRIIRNSFASMAVMMFLNYSQRDTKYEPFLVESALLSTISLYANKKKLDSFE